MARTDLQILVTPAQESVTVTMVGETHFDFDSADKYIRQVLQHKPKTVIVNASKLSYISSIGMCFLINLLRAVRESGGKLHLADLQPMVRKAMEHAHVLHLFDLNPGPMAAVAQQSK